MRRSIRRTRDRLFLQRIPGRANAESMRDVQREVEIRESLGEGRGARMRLYCDRTLRDHRTSAMPRTATAATRRAVSAQGMRSAERSIIFPVQFAAGAIAACAHAARRDGEIRNPRDRPETRPEEWPTKWTARRFVSCRETITRHSSDRISARTNFIRGEIYDLEGNFVGTHDGIEMFTIGQRKGLPGGSPQPRYVIDLDPETNRVIVGQRGRFAGGRVRDRSRQLDFWSRER